MPLKPLDNQLFQTIEPIITSRPIFRELLTQNAAAQKERFLTGQQRNPTLVYALPNMAVLEQEKSRLQALDDITQASQDWPEALRPHLTTLYRRMVADAVAERDLLITAWSPDRPYDAQAFMAAEQAKYGPLDAGIFWYCLQTLVQKCDDEILQKDKTQEGRELKALVAKVRNMPLTHEPRNLPTSQRDMFDAPLHLRDLEAAIKTLPDGTVDIEQLFGAALTIYGLKDWRIEHDKHALNLEVRSSVKKIIISKEHHFLAPHLAFIKTIHEIGVHAQRRELRTDIALYNRGLPDYATFEEGFACVLAGVNWGNRIGLNGNRLYVGIGFAVGTDGTPRDFRSVYELLWRIDVARGFEINKAKDQAYGRCRRLFRGTDFSVAGNCHLKDKSYVEGILAALDYFATTTVTPQLATDLLRYRFTPTDQEHAALINLLRQK